MNDERRAVGDAAAETVTTPAVGGLGGEDGGQRVLQNGANSDAAAAAAAPTGEMTPPA